MADIYLGSTDLSTATFKMGSSDVSALYQGSTQLWAAPTTRYLTSGELTNIYYLHSFNSLLNSSYAGNAFQVRRSSDNATQDIGFDGNGNVDEAALTSFIGGNSGYVTTWYDQSGNGYNMFNTNTSSQARIVNSGTVVKIGGYIAPEFFNVAGGTSGTGNYRYNTKMSFGGAWTTFVVFSRAKNASGTYVWGTDGSGQYPTYITEYGNGLEYYGPAPRQTIDNSASWNTTSLAAAASNISGYPGNVTAFFNGTQVFSVANAWDNSGRSIRNFAANNNNGYNGHFAEFIAYPVDKSSDMSSINSNITTFYGL